MTARSTPSRQRGAALIVVLLLVATLSFILLSITNIVTAGIERSASDRARSDFFWRAAAGETIAREILKKYLATSPARMARGSEIFGDPIELPIEGGAATIAFRDGSACFNINSLVSGGPGSYTGDPTNIAGFVKMLEAVGLGSGEAAKLADVVVDFIDSDDLSSGQGAEDSFYTALPTPYRTSGQLIQSLSELRAMDGVSRTLYRKVQPYLCALAGTAPAPINVNMIGPDHAPVLLARLPADSGVSLNDIRSQIGAVPPGGVSNLEALEAPLSTVPGIAVVSGYIEALIRLEVNDRTIEEKLLFEAPPSAPPKLVARTFGDDH